MLPRDIPHLIDRQLIQIRPELHHRHTYDPKRAATLKRRLESGAHFLPVVLFRKPDGELVLVDGLHRLIAFDARRVTAVSAHIYDDLGQALVTGITMNRPANGKLRGGLDAVKALSILATALGRKLTESQASSLGLRLEEHDVLPPTALKLYPPITLPSLPQPSPSRPNRRPKKRPLEASR